VKSAVFCETLQYAYLYFEHISNCFFPARRYASAVHAVIMSVTRLYCTKTAKRSIKQTMSYDSFLVPKISA